jgi:hypothetical protein
VSYYLYVTLAAILRRSVLFLVSSIAAAALISLLGFVRYYRRGSPNNAVFNADDKGVVSLFIKCPRPITIQNTTYLCPSCGIRTQIRLWAVCVVAK